MKYPVRITFHEKHDNRKFIAHNSVEYKDIMTQVAYERAKAGYWYDAKTNELILTAYQNPRTNFNRFMENRRTAEYEGFTIREMV